MDLITWARLPGATREVQPARGIQDYLFGR